MSVEGWLLFCATEAVLSLSPGPAVLLVTSVALSAGRALGVRSALGILSANAFYFVLSAFGVGALLVRSVALFTALKWVGAIYLIWMGVRMLIGAGGGSEPAKTSEPPQAGRAFLQGFVIQAANPKTLIYFTAILPQFLEPAGDPARQLLVLGASSAIIEGIILAGLAMAAARAGRVARGPSWELRLQRLGGALLIAAGIGLAGVRKVVAS